jgi:hypothetical protein
MTMTHTPSPQAKALFCAGRQPLLHLSVGGHFPAGAGFHLQTQWLCPWRVEHADWRGADPVRDGEAGLAKSSAENIGGKYTMWEDRSYRIGMVWFIFSEVMFFACFFGVLVYIRRITLPELGGYDRPTRRTQASPHMAQCRPNGRSVFTHGCLGHSCHQHAVAADLWRHADLGALGADQEQAQSIEAGAAGADHVCWVPPSWAFRSTNTRTHTANWV